MMDLPRFNIPSALAMLYGIARPITYPGVMAGAERDTPQVSYGGIRVVRDEEMRATSHIGTPIMHPVLLLGGTYKEYDHSGLVVERDLGDLRLPISTVLEMSVTKEITKTQVSASGASVKEVFSHGDWELRLTGIIMDESNHPHGATTLEAMEERLMQFERLADSIAVESELLNRRGVDRLVIRSLNFQAIPGRPRMVGYQMQCESDAPLELLIR